MAQRQNIISQINNSGNSEGDGFRRDIELSLYSASKVSSGAPLTTTLAVDPGYIKTETNATALSWAAGIVLGAAFNFMIPGDYDEAKDDLVMRLLAMSAGTDVPAFTVTTYRKRAGVALATLTAKTTGAISALTALGSYVTADLSGLGCKANDVLTMTVVPGAHATHAANVYAVAMRFKSVLALRDLTAR